MPVLRRSPTLAGQVFAEPTPSPPPPVPLSTAFERPPPQDLRSRGGSGDWRGGPIADPTEGLPMWRGLVRPYLPAWLGGGPMVTRAESPAEFVPFDVPSGAGVLRAPLLGTKAKYVHPTTGEEPTRVYHGTTKPFGEFDPSKADPKALYGPGHYFTESSTVAGGYAAPSMTMRAFDTAADAEAFAATVNGELRQSASMRKGAPAWEVYYRDLESAPNLRPAHLDIRNPFDIDAVYPSDTMARIADAAARVLPGDPKVGMIRSIRRADPMTGDTIYQELQRGALDLDKATINKILQTAGYDGITHTGGKITGGKPHRVWIAFDPKQVISPFEYAQSESLAKVFPVGGRQQMVP